MPMAAAKPAFGIDHFFGRAPAAITRGPMRISSLGRERDLSSGYAGQQLDHVFPQEAVAVDPDERGPTDLTEGSPRSLVNHFHPKISP